MSVNVDVYYESLGDESKVMYRQLYLVVKKLNSYIHLNTYPYGKTETKQENGRYQFVCEHGHHECLGNKLHACAIDVLQNVTNYVEFHACLMLFKSNMRAADRCGVWKKVDSNPIIRCVRTAKGNELLVHYGIETQQKIPNLPHVPYVLIDGKLKPNNISLFEAVCETIRDPPKECVDKVLNNVS